MRRIGGATWSEIRTSYASGIGLREIARNMNIPAGTVLARSKREGWTQRIAQAKLIERPELARDLAKSDAINAITPMQSAAITMQQRGQRYTERMAGVSERVLPHLETLPPNEILELARNVEQFDRFTRRNYGLEADDRETTFLKLFALAQLLLLVVLVTNQYRGVPLAALILGGVALGIHVLTMHTPFGRYLYAIGGNEEAARLSGVPIRASVIGAFAIMGLVVALTGFMQTAYSGASTTTVGSLMELDAIAACVIGGVSLRGGRGTVLGVLFGSLIMASLLNGMTLMAVSPEIKFIARGLVLAFAVWLDVRLSATE